MSDMPLLWHFIFNMSRNLHSLIVCLTNQKHTVCPIEYNIIVHFNLQHYQCFNYSREKWNFIYIIDWLNVESSFEHTYQVIIYHSPLIFIFILLVVFLEWSFDLTCRKFETLKIKTLYMQKRAEAYNEI